MLGSFQISVEVGFRETLIRYQNEQQALWLQNARPFRTLSGIDIDLLNPSPGSLILEDIATGLSKACRYSGQCDGFYSVAEHSILVSRYVEHLENPIPDLVKAAFLHDGQEGYLHDLTTPLKILCPGYQIIEDRFARAIQEAFGLGIRTDHPVIRECDLRMFYRERELLLPGYAPAGPGGSEELDELLEIRRLGPEEAKKAFLERAEEIGVWRAA